MRTSTSKQKLSQMHQQLDRELEMAGFPIRAKTKRDREEFRFVSESDDNKKSILSNISSKPAVYDHEVKEIDIKSKKTEIGDLQRKLMQLEKKMDNFSVSSGDEDERGAFKGKLKFQKKIENKPNQDTARFLIDAEEREKNQTKFTLQCPSLGDQQDEEDSQDYFQIQQAIQKRKSEQKVVNQRKSNEKDTLRVQRDSRERKNNFVIQEDTERKVSVETQSVLRPKYSTGGSTKSIKANDKKSVGKNSVRESIVSNKSVEKNKVLPRANSRGSFRSGDSTRKVNSKSREKMNKSIDRSERGEEFVARNDELEMIKDIKRANNLERELQHYKRLAQKYKSELQDYKVMQIEFRELKKNFAKSEMIRGQQKKIIQTLKSKMGR